MQALASSAAKSKAALNKDRVTIIDTAQILAGRSNSGVTITPAAGNRLTGSHAYAGMSEKLPLPGNLAASLASSGVTISSKTTQLPGGHHQNVQAAVVKPETHSIPGSNFVYDSKGQLQDPNLTDDTIVIEVNIDFFLIGIFLEDLFLRISIKLPCYAMNTGVFQSIQVFLCPSVLITFYVF